MPTKSFQTAHFKDQNLIKAYKRSASKRYINGLLVSVNSKDFKVQNAARILSQKGCLVNYKTNDLSDSMTATYAVRYEAAHAVLESIGGTLIPNQKRTLSFMDTQDSMLPKHIVPERIERLKNNSISARDKFPDKDNPFYNLEENISDKNYQNIRIQKQKNEFIDPTNIVCSIFEISVINNNAETIREFK